MGGAGQPLYSDVMVDLARALALTVLVLYTGRRDAQSLVEQGRLWALPPRHYALRVRILQGARRSLQTDVAGAGAVLDQQMCTPAILKFEISSWVAVEP